MALRTTSTSSAPEAVMPHLALFRMASTGNAFNNPTTGKIDQQRKILEELNRQKQQLNKQNATSSSAITSTTSGTSSSGSNNGSNVASNPPTGSGVGAVGTGQAQGGQGQGGGNVTLTTGDTPPHMLSANQKAALDLASKTSFGYFIPQDSSFGNLILPVIPRLQPTSTKQES